MHQSLILSKNLPCLKCEQLYQGFTSPPASGPSLPLRLSLLPCPLTYPTLGPSSLFRFSSVQSLSHVQLFETPWITARQASLSITNSLSVSCSAIVLWCFHHCLLLLSLCHHLGAHLPLLPLASNPSLRTKLNVSYSGWGWWGRAVVLLL